MMLIGLSVVVMVGTYVVVYGSVFLKETSKLKSFFWGEE